MEVGGPGGKQTQMGPMIALQHEAETIVSILQIPTSHALCGNAAGWLARVWEAEGCPIISAVEQGSAILEGQIRS